ncbi:MAG TPA: PQQ-binding-like beta-propeller repeat protein [Kofleriaceae bacterium]
MTRWGQLMSVLAVALFGCSDRTVVDSGARERVHVDPVPDHVDPYARPPGAHTSVVVAMNRAAPPPDTTQPGSGFTVSSPEATRTANGYRIQFPTRSPVPTPVIHNGRLIVSGGFNSREIYAYEAKTGRAVWGQSLSDDGPSNAACEGELCVFNSESCTTFAVNAKTGKTIWAWWLGDPQTSAPTIANGLAFASYPAYQPPATEQVELGTWSDPWGEPPPAQKAAATGTPSATHALAAFDLATGKPVWRRWLDGDVMSAPVAVDGFLYVSTFGGSVLKLDQKTGEIIYAVAMRATSAPVVVRDQGRESLFVTVRAEERRNETREAIVRADLGATRRTFRANAKAAPYLDGKVQRDTELAKAAQVDDSENGFSTVPAAAGATGAGAIVGVEAVSTMQRFQGSRVLVTADLVISTMGDEVIAVDRASGDVKWRHALTGSTSTEGGHLGTAPLLAGTEVVVATLAGNILRLEAATGKLVAQYKAGMKLRSQPVVHEGWIYAGSEDGTLIAINTGNRALTGWPTWGGDSGRTAVR